MHVFKSTANRW